jgi:hypothetical protein
VAVAVRDGQAPAVVHGEIHDGHVDDRSIRDSMVWDGFDERAALHEVCWELAGKPERWTRQWNIGDSELAILRATVRVREARRRRTQLDDRRSALGPQKNRARIVELLGIARA